MTRKPLVPIPRFLRCAAGPCALAALLCAAAVTRAAALEEWPLVLVSNGVTNTLYQPQLDSWDYSTLTAHAAVSVQPSGASQCTFGVVDVTTRTHVDRAERMVFFEDLQVTKASFPSAPSQASAGRMNRNLT